MKKQSNFIKTIIENDLKENHNLKIITRFPPEPNGYLHIGHARAIIINFELAKFFKGTTNLRFDDTNPEKESKEFVNAIKEDIKWLGYEPAKINFASNYFNEMYQRAIILIKKGLAYVDNQSHDEIQKTRGTLTTKGIESKDRNNSVEKNLEEFEKMRKGFYPEGAKVLRAKIDMASDNMNMRDPIIYRISNQTHHNTKNKWKIYPMYDFAHPLEDAIENITHSLCSLEFEDHRPLYDWFVKNTEMAHIPRQIEFGRLNLENTFLSKRFLRELVLKKLVWGWDDPRMPTIKGMRRRGYPASSIRNFILDTGLSKTNGTVKQEMLEHFIREDLKLTAEPHQAIVNPLLVEIENLDENFSEEIKVPKKFSKGFNKIIFSKFLYIEREDFEIQKPDKNYKRLFLNGEVRLMHAYFIKCKEIIYNNDKTIKKIICTYDPKTKSGSNFNERKPNGTIHFLSKEIAVPCKVNSFDFLAKDQDVNNNDVLKMFNENSLKVKNSLIPNYLVNLKQNEKIQFIRNGYYTLDKLSTKSDIIFNEIVKLKSSYK